jgi:uncharacterized protein
VPRLRNEATPCNTSHAAFTLAVFIFETWEQRVLREESGEVLKSGTGIGTVATPWSWKDVAIFLCVLAMLDGVGSSFAIMSGNIFGAHGYYVYLLMWSPGIAAFATAIIAKRRIDAFGWKWGEWKWQIQAWFLPIAYICISYALIWGMGLGKVPNPEFVDKAVKSVSLHISPTGATLLLIGLTGIFGMSDIGGALGEEIGWRGFLVPALYHLTNKNFTATVLINGCIWALWHSPIIFLSSYNNPGVPRWYSFSCFFVLCISGAAIADRYRLRSGSLWTGVLLHPSHNLYLQSIFTPLTANTGRTQYFIDEFGLVLPLVTLMFAIYFWSRRNDLVSVAITPKPA